MKRGYLMSYTRKAKKGYYGVAVYRDENGKRRQKSAGCFKLKREAVSAAVALEKKLNAINQPLKDISLADYYQRWYETYKQNGLSGISKSRYEIFHKVISNYFGDKKLRAIRRSDYQQFINEYGAKQDRKSTRLNSSHP